MDLTFEEVRVLGCLVEKSANTPEHYPLTTNSLVSACNQKTSREPVVSFSTRQVDETVLLLRQAGLARSNMSGRSSKHRHIVEDALDITTNEAVALSVMMLRGPQSAGELKTRTDRAIALPDSAAAESILQSLADRSEPLVRNIGRGSGQSMDRWVHLLSSDAPTVAQDIGVAEEQDVGQVPSDAAYAPAPMSVRTPSPELAADEPTRRQLVDRIDALERRLATLEAELGIGPLA